MSIFNRQKYGEKIRVEEKDSILWTILRPIMFILGYIALPFLFVHDWARYHLKKFKK